MNYKAIAAALSPQKISNHCTSKRRGSRVREDLIKTLKETPQVRVSVIALAVAGISTIKVANGFF